MGANSINRTRQKTYTPWDYANYGEIMFETNALYRNNDRNETRLKANKSWKWKCILRQSL